AEPENVGTPVAVGDVMTPYGVALVVCGMMGDWSMNSPIWLLRGQEDISYKLRVRWVVKEDPHALPGLSGFVPLKPTGSLAFESWRGGRCRSRYYLAAGFTPEQFIEKLERFVAPHVR